jgi:3-methyladenine DNA glycosylase AlkD
MNLLNQLRSELKQAADPKKAPPMQAYMKSAMPYHGAQSPVARAVFKKVFKDIEFKNAAAWKKEVLAVWTGARFREERYAAIELTGHKAAKEFQTLDALPLYEKLIVDGAWWDYVDWIAGQRINPMHKQHLKPMRAKMLNWSKCGDLWKRRTAILSQMKFRGETDIEFLHACIEPSLGSKEFFLQKAIGWALREYAWADPQAVRRYVKKYEDRLAPLSKREALKNI